MNAHRSLPKGHTSLLSPQFRYVPAACTDLAATFARIRGDRMHLQPAPGERADRRRLTGDGPELDIEVLEAAWLMRRPGRLREQG